MKKEDKELIELFASIKQHQKNIERQEKIFSAICNPPNNLHNKVYLFLIYFSTICICVN